METVTSIFMEATSPIQLLTGQTPQEMVLGDTLASEMKTGVASEEITPKKPRIGRSDLGEIETYFTALERDLDHLQQLHQEQQEQHRLELIAVERVREQERMEWEREWRQREEAILATLMSALVCRQKLMADMRSHSAPLVSIKQLAGTAASKEVKPGTWWRLKIHQAAPDAAPQDTSSSTSASKNSEADTFDLQKLIELEKRVRKAEAKKQQKSLAKAKKKAQKLEKRRAKKDANKTKGEDNRVQGTQPKRWWQRHLLAMSCITTPCED